MPVENIGLGIILNRIFLCIDVPISERSELRCRGAFSARTERKFFKLLARTKSRETRGSLQDFESQSECILLG